MPHATTGAAVIRGSRTRRLLGVLFAALALGLALPPSSASAHAELLSTDPAAGAVLATAPTSVELIFDEAVFLVPDGFQLYDATGTHRTVPAAAVDATVRATMPTDLPDGSYVLGWRVVSDDSHPESGLVPFSIGHADATAPVVDQTDSRPVGVVYGALTALGYLGLYTLVGLTVFDLFVSRTVTAGGRLHRLAAVVAIGAYLVLVPLTVVRERGSGLGGLFDPSAVGTGWPGPAILTLVLAGAGIGLMMLRPRLPGRIGPAVGAVGAAVALASVLPVGHTRTFGPTWLVMGADLVHAAAASIWLGGLIALGLHLARGRRRQDDPAGAAVVLGRFSTLAGGIVVLVGITGTILAVVIVGSVPALVGTAYGRLLLVKVGLVGVIGGLAAWNRYWLVPRIGRKGGATRAWRQISLAVRWEAVGLIVVVGLTSALTLQNPRAAEASVPAPATSSVPAPAGTPVLADLGTGHLSGQLTPGATGENVFTFEITDAGGNPIVPLGTPQVSVAEPNLSLGPFIAEVEVGPTPGSYRAVVDVPAQGQWKITAAVRINELEQPAAVADVVVLG
ncbi:MAG: copper resistance protein CopC [Nakamurella sp.]